MTDDSKWYTRSKGKTLGPFSWPQLETMRNRGQLSRFHELSQDRTTWIPAGDLADLFRPNDLDPSLEVGAAEASSYGVNQPPSASASMPDSDHPAWHHAQGGQSVGPLRLQDLRSLIARGELEGSTLVWRDGMPNWLSARNVPELAPFFATVQTPHAPIGYAQANFSPAGPPQTSSLAVASLVLGLVWLCGLGSLLAVIFGGVSLAQISKSRGTLEGKGMAVAGLVLGIIGLTIIAFIWLSWFGFVGAIVEMNRQQELKRIRGF